jgi:long-subunit acyl-CoA synthetase (AMP-forming)
MDESLRKTMQGNLLYGALIVTYGMTEMAGLIALTSPFQSVSNSVGKLVPNTKMKVRKKRAHTINFK